MTHIDDWMYQQHWREDKAETVAKVFFQNARLPAHFQATAMSLMPKLFCQYKSKKYRVTGASRHGDVWLTDDFKQETGYQLRVAVDDLSGWEYE